MFPTRLFFMIFLLVGLILLGVSAYTYQQTSTFIRTAVKAEGHVVEMHSRRSRSKSGSSSTYTPVVRFRTSTNEEIRFTSTLSTSPPMFHVGEKVTVLYRRDTPNDAQISDFWSIWFATVFLAGMGTVFAGVGGGLMFSPLATISEDMERRFPERFRNLQRPR